MENLDPPRRHPYLYVTEEPCQGLLSVEDLRLRARAPATAEFMQRFLDRCNDGIGQEPLRQKGSEAPSCPAACDLAQRLSDWAIAVILTKNMRFKNAAMRQIRSLLDHREWPDWDGMNSWVPIALRGAHIARYIALAYDWMEPWLTPREKELIIAGLDERAIQPFLISMKHGLYPTHRRNNWCSVVVGGMGVVAMALYHEHPDAPRIVDYSLERMRWMIGVYGEEGEFNESPGYTDSFPATYGYFEAYRYWSRNRVNDMDKLFKVCKWSLYALAPGGRYLNHGDSGGGQFRYWFLPLITNTARDPTLKWFHQYLLRDGNGPTIEELLALDASLPASPPKSPEWPLGRAYREHGGLISSRSSWDIDRAASVVFSKSRVEGWAHQHNDLGQVMIFGHGKDLIVDDFLHNYPDGYWDEDKRFAFHFSSDKAHNVVTVGQYAPRFDFGAERSIPWGALLDSAFDEEKGGWWKLDMSQPERGIEMRRTVAHGLPNIVAVLDDVRLREADDMVLRWHTGKEPVLFGATFEVRNDGVALEALICCLDGAELTITSERCPVGRYCADIHGTGFLPYIKVAARGKRMKILTLFAVFGRDESPCRWRSESGNRWLLGEDAGAPSVVLSAESLLMQGVSNRLLWNIPLSPLV